MSMFNINIWSSTEHDLAFNDELSTHCS